MTPTHDVVQKLLGALKDEHQKHMDAINVDLRDSSVGCKVCKLIAQTEAQLAGEGTQPCPDCGGSGAIPRCCRRFVGTGEGCCGSPEPEMCQRCDTTGHVPVSPTNACIRAAKRVIAALNLPEGAGVAFDDVAETWEVYDQKPHPFEGPVPNWRGWRNGSKFRLPDTAIPQWPGDFRESWITASTEEVTE